MRVKIFLNLAICFCIVSFCNALQITEIQYDPAGTDTDREWLEIYNDTAGTIKLTDYKFFEANTNHGIVKTTDENVLTGEYVILAQDLAKFKVDNPGNNLKVFTSSFSLSNSGEVLSLKDKSLNIIFTIDYTNYLISTGNGATINFKNGSTATNTGTSTTTSTTTTIATQSATSTTSAGDYAQPTYFGRSYYPDSEKILVNAGKNLVGIMGQELSFSGNAKTGENRELASPTYFWSFGDGASAEGKKAKHEYKFTGEYVAVLEVYANGNRETDRIYVKITDPDIKLSLITKNNLPAVSIMNNSIYEIDLGNLFLNSSTTRYSLPKNFSILPKRNIDVAFEICKFATSTSGVFLSLENGKKLSEYFLAATPTLTFSLATTSITNNSFLQNSSSTKTFVRKKFWKKQNATLATTTKTQETIATTGQNNFIIKNEGSGISNFFKFLGL